MPDQPYTDADLRTEAGDALVTGIGEAAARELRKAQG